MSYFKNFGLDREPFSTSPDPSFFFLTKTHKTALTRLEISLRLKRGLNVVFGDVGTGKTTLSRTLIRNFTDDDDFEFHMIFDPGYKSEYQFLYALSKLFHIQEKAHSTTGSKYAIENFLFNKNLHRNKTVVLIIDEGQKLSSESLEILRVFLNYETNEHKLLQLIIFSQLELLPRLKVMPNFLDRISLKYVLEPLNAEEARSMIHFRLCKAGCSNPETLIEESAIELIYENSGGFPRKITYICRNAVERAIMNDQTFITCESIHNLINEDLLLNERRIFA
ncbi:MAG: AAA family ATPase [Candidatus Theseobacter exili]|nr:AAA family ATPase [Candidatus Theseobacter exili]